MAFLGSFMNQLMGSIDNKIKDGEAEQSGQGLATESGSGSGSTSRSPSTSGPAAKDAEPEWTDGDTSEMMDLMELALGRISRKVVTNMEREKYGRDEGLGDEIELEMLEDTIRATKEDTSSVIKEISNVMQVCQTFGWPSFKQGRIRHKPWPIQTL